MMKIHKITEFSRSKILRRLGLTLSVGGMLLFWGLTAESTDGHWFEGKHYRRHGDVEYLQLLDTAPRIFEPDPEFQNLSTLYTPLWDGSVEGPTWNILVDSE